MVIISIKRHHMEIPNDVWKSIIKSRGSNFLQFRNCTLVNKQLYGIMMFFCDQLPKEIRLKANLNTVPLHEAVQENNYLIHPDSPTRKWSKTTYSFDPNNCFGIIRTNLQELKMSRKAALSSKPILLIMGLFYIKVPLRVKDIFADIHEIYFAYNTADNRYYVAHKN